MDYSNALATSQSGRELLGIFEAGWDPHSCHANKEQTANEYYQDNEVATGTNTPENNLHLNLAGKHPHHGQHRQSQQKTLHLETFRNQTYRNENWLFPQDGLSSWCPLPNIEKEWLISLKSQKPVWHLNKSEQDDSPLLMNWAVCVYL